MMKKHAAKDLITREESKESSVITYCQATKKVFLDTGSYIVTRITVSLSIIFNGVVLAKLSASENAAGPLVTTLTYAVLGTSMSVLRSTGMVIGEKYGAGETHQIGKTLRKSWVLSGVLSIPTIGILLSSEFLLPLLGIQKEVAHETQRFFYGLSIGIPAILLLTCNQQFALAVEQRKVVLISGTSYALLSMAIGFPIALTTTLGIFGLGLGSAISGWICVTGIKLYFRLKNSDFDKYELFKIKCENSKLSDFKELLRRGLALGFQNITEWANLLAMSIMTGKISSNDLVDLQVSLRPTSAYLNILTGLAQGVGIMVSQRRGASQKALKQSNMELVQVTTKNARIIGNTGIVIGFTSSLVIGGIFIALTSQLISIFQGSHGDSLASSFLLINSIGLLTDSIRNVANTILIGNNDPWIPPLLSFIFMSILAAPAGGIVSLYFGQSANWLFITRDIGISLSAMGIGYRWLRKSNSTLERAPIIDHEIDKQEDSELIVNASDIDSTEEKKSSSWFSFFKNTSRQDHYEEIDPSRKNCSCTII